MKTIKLKKLKVAMLYLIMFGNQIAQTQLQLGLFMLLVRLTILMATKDEKYLYKH